MVIRFVMRIISPPRQKTNRPNTNFNQNTQAKGAESLEKPRFTIEAESVDYEIIEEPKKKNEE